MSTQTTTQVQSAPEKRVSIANFLNYPATDKFLSENLREKRGEFVSNLIALCEADANLAACDPKSLMMCAMNATSLNLPLNKNLGFAYVIPYKGVPSFQIGYKGYIQMALRTGLYEFLNACEIREGEMTRNKFTGELKFNGDKPENPVIGYLAYLKLLSGFSASLYMTLDEMEQHATRFSKMYQADKQYKTMKSKWSDPLARPKMALKTVLKNLLGTYGVMTTDMQKAFEADGDQENATGAREFDDVEVMTQEEPAMPQADPSTTGTATPSSEPQTVLL
jgi:recombination protein RecT